MLEHLKNATNTTYTENGAVAYQTNNSELMDWFAQAGALRSSGEQRIVQLFSKAFAESPLLAMKSLFYMRDIREGQGERRTFRVALKYLAHNHTEVIRKNIRLIPDMGRWDDLFELFDTPCETDVLTLIHNQLSQDLNSDNISLASKWMPSENTSSYETRAKARKIRNYLNMTPREYRKMLSSLRKKIDLIETKLTNKQYEKIDYSKIPSKAGLKYRSAFYRNDEDRYQKFLDAVKSGSKNINTGTLYPYDIVHRVPRYFNAKHDESLDVMWNNLPDYIEGQDINWIAVVDTSGSMSGTPIEVAVSLGMYFAEHNSGEFKNHFITFSAKPKLQKIVGNNITEKVNNLCNADWEMNTDIEAVFDLILNTAVKNHVPQSEMIDKILIISDMEFDAATRKQQFYGYGGWNSHQIEIPTPDKKLFETIRERYESAGYQMPSLVFWNVDARNSQFPMTMNDAGVQLVSGMSPSIFKNLLAGQMKSAYELMLEILESERYSAVTL